MRAHEHLEHAVVWLADRPILWRSPRWGVSSYGALIGLGFDLGAAPWLALLRFGFGRPLPGVLMLLGLAPAAYAGGRTVLVLDALRRGRFDRSLLGATGHLVHGGVAGALAFAWAATPSGQSLGLVLDTMTPGFCLGYAIGKLGCLARGCCFGRRAPEGVLAVTYHAAVSGAVCSGLRGARLLPSPLYEASYALVLLALTLGATVALRGSAHAGAGAIFAAWLVLFTLGRAYFLGLRYAPTEGAPEPRLALPSAGALAALGLPVLLLPRVAGIGTAPAIASDLFFVAGVGLGLGLLTAAICAVRPLSGRESPERIEREAEQLRRILLAGEGE